MTQHSVHLAPQILKESCLVFLTRQTATAIRFSSNAPNPRKLIHHRAKHGSYFSLAASPHFLSSHLNLLPSLYSSLPVFCSSQVVPTKSMIQPLKSSSFISISGRFPLFTEGVRGGAMNGKVIGSELKWNRLFRLRCVVPCNVQWMRKYCKAESAGRGSVCVCVGGGHVVSTWGAAAAGLRATLWNVNSDSAVICVTLSIWAWNPLFTLTFRALLSQPLNVKNWNWKATFHTLQSTSRWAILAASVTLSRWDRGVGFHKRKSKQNTWKLSAKVGQRGVR